MKKINTALFRFPLPMADNGDEAAAQEELSDKEKKDIAVWFLSNAPVGEISYVAKDICTLIGDDKLYDMAASEAFPRHNKAHLLTLELPDRSGDVIISGYGEIDKYHYLEPRTAQVATVDHIKQVCTRLRPATDDELPSLYIEEFRSALDVELYKYVAEAYPKGICAVYCTRGKHIDGPGNDFDFVAIISASKRSPHNFCNGSWKSTWTFEFKDGTQLIEVKGKIKIAAHYFEEGNVQLDTKNEITDSTVFQLPEDCAVQLTNIIRHHESEYLQSLEASYQCLPDSIFKDLRRKLPITRTLFPWHNTLQFSITRDLSRELGIGG